MENIEVRCTQCNKITRINVKVLLPYSGKAIKIKCQNPECQAEQKLTVPVFVSEEQVFNKTVIEPRSSQEVNNDKTAQNKPAAKKAILRVLKNENTEAQIFDLENGLYTVGRYVNKPGVYVPDIAIRTNDTFISKKHCHVMVVVNKKGEKDYLLKDAGSSNGTFYNRSDKAMLTNDEIYLNDADVIMLGDTQIIFELK
ncbi:MAG: FHA domain-containing protein [Lentimicrobium sp.]